ncbi:hypothetical protein ACET3Z_031728 [Daucus carota]
MFLHLVLRFAETRDGAVVMKATGVPFLAGQRKVAACAKHFVGDGGTNKGIHENNTIISSLGLFSIHMPAYYNSIIKGVAIVMIAYSSWNGDASLVRIMKSRKVLGQ